MINLNYFLLLAGIEIGMLVLFIIYNYKTSNLTIFSCLFRFLSVFSLWD